MTDRLGLGWNLVNQDRSVKSVRQLAAGWGELSGSSPPRWQTKQNMDAVDGINTTVPPQTEDDIDAVPVCRICLMTNLVMRDLFHENDVSLSTKAMSFANVKVRRRGG